MKTKEVKKGNKKIKITIKNIVILMAIFVVMLCVTAIYFAYFENNKVFGKEEVYSNNKENKIEISKANITNIDKIIEKNLRANNKEQIEKKEEELEYLTTYRQNASLPQGKLQVIQEGRNGKQEIITKKVYNNEELISEEQISAKVTRASVNKIVEIGTSNIKITNYKAKIGDTVYATSVRLSVKVEPSEDAQKIATLSKNSKLKILDIQEGWYKISCNNTYGWVNAESTSNIDPNPPKEEKKQETPSNNNSNQKSKDALIANLDFEMQLNKPSGLTLEQFEKILTDEKDTLGVLKDNAKYFYYIEEQYNINGVFVASMAIHESAWGTSKIAQNKKNLFGYGAYDSNPYNGAYNFENYSECIDLIARVLVKYYLNTPGTSIYGGETAVGTYYNGATLSGVNTRYASDKGWANKVYNYMKYLYNKL